MGFDVVKDYLVEAVMGEASSQQRIFLLRSLLWVLFIAHMLWATGIWLPGAEAGFATKHQFQTLKENVQRIEVNQLTAKIEMEQERLCKANLERNRDASRYAANRRNEFMRQYLELTGKTYSVPTCPELGFGGEVDDE